MRVGPLVLALAMITAGCSQAVAEPPLDPELVGVAEDVCTVMWDWQLDVGGIMNIMSAASKQEPDPQRRMDLFRVAFADTRARNAELAAELESIAAGPYVDRMREDVRNGLFAADGVIDQVETEVSDLYAAGVDGYHPVVSHIFIGFEKVIDVAKPEIADYANPELTRAFVSVAQCQHGVKDANDGRPRHVPSS